MIQQDPAPSELRGLLSDARGNTPMKLDQFTGVAISTSPPGSHMCKVQIARSKEHRDRGSGTQRVISIRINCGRYFAIPFSRAYMYKVFFPLPLSFFHSLSVRSGLRGLIASRTLLGRPELVHLDHPLLELLVLALLVAMSLVLQSKIRSCQQVVPPPCRSGGHAGIVLRSGERAGERTPHFQGR